MLLNSLISTFYKRPVIKNLTTNNEVESRSGNRDHIKRPGRDSNPGQGIESPILDRTLQRTLNLMMSFG